MRPAPKYCYGRLEGVEHFRPSPEVVRVSDDRINGILRAWGHWDPTDMGVLLRSVYLQGIADGSFVQRYCDGREVCNPT